MRSKALAQHGKYRFDKFGVCENPSEFFKYQGVVAKIRILVAEHPPGHLAGYEINYIRSKQDFQVMGRSSFPTVATIYNKQENAVLDAGLEILQQLISNMHEPGFEKITADVDFMQQYLTKYGYVQPDYLSLNNTEMSKQNTPVISIDADSVDEITDMLQQIQKPVLITSADIKEEQCNYGYEINNGPGKGDKVTRKGSSLIHHDMDVAFAKLNKHLAHIDDAFIHIKKKPQTVDELESHEGLVSNFRVTGFKITGSDENEGYVLKGEKYVNQGIIGLETPKISVSSGYHFFDDLQEVIEECRQEVEQYMNGKQAPKMEQGELEFSATGGEGTEFDNPE